MTLSSLLAASVLLPSVSGHGMMTVPPSWQTNGGKLGVTAGGPANERGIDDWYTDKTWLATEVPLSSDSPFRTYQDASLAELLRWGLSVKYHETKGKILERNVGGLLKDKKKQAKLWLSNNKLWTVAEIRMAQERLELLFPDGNPYKFFDVPREISAEEIYAAIHSDNATVETCFPSMCTSYDGQGGNGTDCCADASGRRELQTCQDGYTAKDLGPACWEDYTWYTCCKALEKESLLTVKRDVWVSRPWRAPGSAHIDSPCGVFGGNHHGCPGVGKNPVFYPFGDCPQGGSSYGPKAETLNFPNLLETVWQPGAVVEVGWTVSVNHGGGYSYRLCNVTDEGKASLTEECFQQTPLEFVGNTSWIQYTNDTSSRKAFTAVRTNEGTTPGGSQWTRNPVPACEGADGGVYEESFYDPSQHQCTPQFEPSVEGVLGHGIHNFLKIVIVDLVQIPADLPAGKYVLSHRWDCEQTMQVWASCTDVSLSVV